VNLHCRIDINKYMHVELLEMIWKDRMIAERSDDCNLVAVVELFQLVVGTQTDKSTAFWFFSTDRKLEMKGKGLNFCQCLKPGNMYEK
jgi:hypothetical protein